MDIKAMAKSKRTHTSHNQPRKPHPKPPSSTSSSNPNPSKNEAKGKKVKSHLSSLPSNWGRYNDGDEEDQEEEEGVVEMPVDSGLGSENPSRLAKGAPGLAGPKPKSKGADFGYLVAQAKESKSHCAAPSFDDTLPDFYQGLGPMLAVRGQSILSWEGGDNFLLEDEGTTPEEGPLFSLNLQALAEQLEKEDLAERLFIESDLLPPELLAPGESDDQRRFKKHEKQKKAVGETFEELFSLYLAAEQEAEGQVGEDKAGEVSSSIVISTSNDEQVPAADVSEHKSDDLGFLEARETPLAGHVTEHEPRLPSGFEAATAEAELDLLLNSFNETKLSDSSAASQPEAYSSIKQQNVPISSLKGNSVAHVVQSQDSPGQSTTAFPGGFDDSLDDLLAETSKSDQKGGLPESTQIQVTSFDLPSSSSSTTVSSSKSKVLDDFDSWFDSL